MSLLRGPFGLVSRADAAAAPPEQAASMPSASEVMAASRAEIAARRAAIDGAVACAREAGVAPERLVELRRAGEEMILRDGRDAAYAAATFEAAVARAIGEVGPSAPAPRTPDAVSPPPPASTSAPAPPLPPVRARGPRGFPHLLGRVFGPAHLVTPERAKVLVDVLDAELRGAGARVALEDQGDAGDGDGTGYTVTPGGVAVLPIEGTLVAKSGFMDALSGLVSYQALGVALEQALADPAVRGILLDVNSPGGEAAGCFELVDRIAAARGRKPIYAVADPMAASGAYALAAAASRVYAPEVSYVGSIGVYAMHRDQSAADAAAGLSYTFVSAGARKVDGHPHAPMSDAARAAAQERVDSLYGIFVESVARNRGLSPAAVRATEAGVFLGAQAKQLGLVDVVGDAARALADLERAVTAPAGGASWAR